MVRVLHVFILTDRGGAETMIMNQYRSIDRSKIQFDFVKHTNTTCSYDKEIENFGGRIYHVPRFNGVNFIQYRKAWINFLKQHNEYKIIHIHCYTIAGVIASIARDCGIPVRIVHCHTANPHYSFINKFVFNVLRNIAEKNMTNGFACSYDAGNFFFKKKSFQVLNNAINSKQFSYNQEKRCQIRSEFSFNNKFVIGHVGNFSVVKNHTFIIDIFAEVAKQNKNVLLMLVGEGPLRKEIENKVLCLNLKEKVIFTGTRTDIPDLLQAVDVFLFPSLWEGLGISAVEAQASGLHTIISDTIPQEAFVTDLCESISLQEPVSVWADKILQYTNGCTRKDTFEQIVNAGYDICEHTKWLQNLYLTLYNER